MHPVQSDAEDYTKSIFVTTEQEITSQSIVNCMHLLRVSRCFVDLRCNYGTVLTERRAGPGIETTASAPLRKIDYSSLGEKSRHLHPLATLHDSSRTMKLDISR